MKIVGYKEGMEHFQKKEYAQAIHCFETGTCFGGSSKCLLMLGMCHESGLGVKPDLILAKDYYKVALLHFGGINSTEHESILWLQTKLEQLNNIPDLKEQRRNIDGIGPVIVKRSKVNSWTISFNDEGTIIKIGPSTPFCRGFLIVKDHTKRSNKHWTCDGNTRFYDGYTLETDFFNLVVSRGQSNSFESRINGLECRVWFPSDAELSHLYIQENIMNKVRTLLKKRAEIAFPQKLKEVSERIGVPFNRCCINTRLKKAWACFFTATHDIEFSLSAIQLPAENFEALCIHELMHSFSDNHDNKFWNKLKEYGGEQAYNLDFTHDRHGKWPCLKL